MTGFKNITYIVQLSHFRSLRKIPQCLKKQKKIQYICKKITLDIYLFFNVHFFNEH